MRFLIIYSKPICYNSLEMFTSVLSDSLRKLGHEVDNMISFDRVERLEPFFDKVYDRIIDFNSNLPTMKLEDGTSVLSHLKGEFYNYLLDHPLYHHRPLSSEVEQNVICVDRKHVDYIKKYYPHIKNVLFIPIGRMPSEPLKIKKIRGRSIPVLFTGTYTSSRWAQAKLSVCHPVLADEIMAIYENMRDDSSLEIADALIKYTKEVLKIEIPQDRVAEFAHTHFLADVFAAAQARDCVIRGLLKAGIPVTVCGGGWDEFETTEKDLLTILPAMDYSESLELCYDAKICLNVMPHFTDGIHDRVLNAMSHGAVSLTDSTPYLRENFDDNKHLILYNLENLDEIPTIIKEYLTDDEAMQRIVDAAKYQVERSFTWEELIRNSDLVKE